MQKTLDLAIKKQETGAVEGGYLIGDNMCYTSYMRETEWNAFLKSMKKEAFIEYGAGSGGEMKATACRPPKMASYGSSSRMLYNYSKDIEDFHFEYKLPTTVGGIANLDGFFENSEMLVFVEAKCREPYGAKSVLIERKYEKLYQYISEDCTSNLTIYAQAVEGKIQVEFSVGDCVISKFDIKQMICHLLGIATKLLKDYTDKTIQFLYFCYNPKLLTIDNKKQQEAIVAVYNQMCQECQAVDFKALFATVVRYLSEELKVGCLPQKESENLANNFIFKLCDQSNYLDNFRK